MSIRRRRRQLGKLKAKGRVLLGKIAGAMHAIDPRVPADPHKIPGLVVECRLEYPHFHVWIHHPGRGA